ncbi:MAG: hypothetical protein JNM96_09315, partial [Bacteroidia bacterium]|nr:hypothetical protein [Bacteroidia bacterium]
MFRIINAKIVAFILLSFGSMHLHSQEIIHAKGIVYNNTVYLRWLTATLPYFKQCNTEGFVVKKIEWNKSTLPDSSAFKKPLKVEFIKSKSADDLYW